MSQSSAISILGSGVTLGVYNPALVLRNRLRAMGLPCGVHMIENLFNCRRRDNIQQTKRAFHRNFSVALNGQKMTGDISAKFEADLVADCLEHWRRDRVRDFCVFSGFWMPVVRRYCDQLSPAPCNVHLCLMDSVLSTSWKPFVSELTRYRQHRLFDHATKSVAYDLPVSTRHLDPPTREKRLVVHGGGWGMGSYRKAIDELTAAGIPADIICYEENDVEPRDDGSRNFMIDPQWKPWEPKGGDYVFPPFAEIVAGVKPTFGVPTDHPDVYDLASSALGIVSKPGGATLLDSFSSATPLVFLPEAFGDYEKKNGELWQLLGFGIDFPTWRQNGFSIGLLQDLRENILRYKESQKPPLLENEIARATEDRRCI
jgi:hypothetical protein